MRTLVYEMKKMFIHQKGLLFVCLFLVLCTASTIIFDKPVNPDIELYSEQYFHYLNQVQGFCSEKTEEFFNNEENRILQADVTLKKTYEDFYYGKISKDKFLKKSAPLKAIVQNKKGFDIIYNQFAYVRENPNNRYLIYPNGWDALLSNDSLDFSLVLLLLLLVTPVFCYEFESEMDTLVLTAKKGTRYHALIKICLVFGIVALLCLFTFNFKYVFFSVKYGLKNGNFPLQSLSYFSSSTKQLTLFQTFLLASACKLFGYLTFAMLIMFVSVCSKKYAFTLFSCTAVILLPYLGLNLESAKYYLPGPLGFMIATGFFKGCEYKHNYYTDQLEIIFREVTLKVWILLFVITLSLGIVMFFVIIRRHTNAWGIKTRKHFRNPISLLFILCVVSSSLVGCNRQNTDSYDIYNMCSRESFKNDDFRFYVDNTGSKTSIEFEDKTTGEIQSLIKNPMQSMTEINPALYGNGSLVYYIKYDLDKSKHKTQYNRISIIEVDTKTFDEKIIFERNINVDRKNFLDNTDQRYLFMIYAFFLDDHNIYFICSKDITQINRITGAVKVIPITGKGNIAYDGQYIYYISEKYQIVKYDTNTGSKFIFPNTFTEHFYLSETEILYPNPQDKDRIYTISLENGLTHKVSDRSVLSVRCDEQYIYYTDKKDLKNYRMDRNGQNTILFEE